MKVTITLDDGSIKEFTEVIAVTETTTPAPEVAPEVVDTPVEETPVAPETPAVEADVTVEPTTE